MTMKEYAEKVLGWKTTIREDGFVSVKNEDGATMTHPYDECPNGGCCYCNDLPEGAGYRFGYLIRKKG